MFRHRRPFVVTAALAAAALFVLLPAAAAAGAPADGWVRVTHLSPDTKQVDVTLSALSGGTVLYKLSGVGYGAVSHYMALPAGTYAIAMVPAGAPSSTPPVVKASVTVSPGQSETVAALGLNKNLETRVYHDDLSAPAAGKARARVVQASTKHDAVSVTAGGTTVAKDAGFGTASSYADLAAGSQPVKLTAGSATGTSTASLPAGSVNTIFVLDTASGGLTANTVLDSSGSGVMPSGAIDTGAGGLAARSDGALPLAALAALAAAAGSGVAALALVRRRQPIDA